MATLGTKQVLINSYAAWKVTFTTTTINIPGFGSFLLTDMIAASISASRGVAAVKGIYTYTVTSALTASTPTTADFTLEVETNRWASDQVRNDTTPGKKYLFSLQFAGGESATAVALALKNAIQARIDTRNDLPFTVSVASAVITFTMLSENDVLKSANTGYLGNPLVSNVGTLVIQPVGLTTVVATGTAPVPALGAAADIEENEFMATATSVAPYAEKITDLPLPGASYMQFAWDIALTPVHEIQGAADERKGARSYAIFLNEADILSTATTSDLRDILNAIAARATGANFGWTALTVT